MLPSKNVGAKGGSENVVLYDDIKTMSEFVNQGPANMEAASKAVDYDISTLAISNFEDRLAFVASSFNDESRVLQELQNLLTEGQYYVGMLYTYRCCSKALPMVQNDTPEDKRLEIHQRTFEILRPEMDKLLRFMEFHTKAIKMIITQLAFQHKLEQNSQVPAQAIHDKLVECINMLVLLDELKDMKASLTNDFSRYKRAFAPIRSNMDQSDQINDEIHNLQMFLGNPQMPKNLILHNLKVEIQKMDKYDIAIVSLLLHCEETLTERRFMFPDEEHGFLRVIPFLIYFIDAIAKDTKSGINVFQYSNDRLHWTYFQKLLKVNPIVPLYADMRLNVSYVLRRCPHWNDEEHDSQWVTARPEKLTANYMLFSHHEKYRQEHNTYVRDFARMVNEIKAFNQSSTVVTPEFLGHVFDVLLRGLKMLCAWSAKMKEQVAWKFENPVTHERYAALGGRPHAGRDYDCASKYNYSPAELDTLIDVVSMIKGTGGMMLDNEALIMPLIHRAIHDDAQVFLQNEVARPLRKAHKNKKKEVKDVLLMIREIGGDWLNYDNQKEDYLLVKEQLLKVSRDFPKRATAPSLTQIALVRRMMHTVFSSKAAGMQGGWFSEKNLKDEWIPVWDKHYRASFFYKYLLDYGNTVKSVTDMSHLWYREFFLEMAKSVQFPISMSMPWILTEHLINTQSQKENIFFAMDIYNDAAARALYNLKQQHLYDEVEAELNLSFDQLLFALSNDVFSYYKSVAASMLIDKEYARTFEAAKGAKVLTMKASRYVAIMSQSHVQLLGRSVDVHGLLSQYVTVKFRQNIETVIKKFEASELTHVIDLQRQLDNARLAHKLVAQYLTMDPWEQMFREINEETKFGQFHGRIVTKIVSELALDVLVNFVYNSTTQRFVRGPTDHAPKDRPKPDRHSAPKNVDAFLWYGNFAGGSFKEAFERQHQLLRGYFGMEHIEAILDVISAPDIGFIASELTEHLCGSLQADFWPYMQALVPAMALIKPPKPVLGVFGCYGTYEPKLKNIAAFEELRSHVFNFIRYIGNSLVFMQCFESAVAFRHDLAFLQSSYFTGVAVKPPRDPSKPVVEPADSSAFTFPELAEEKGVPLVNVVEGTLDIAIKVANASKNPSGPQQVQLANETIASSRLAAKHHITVTSKDPPSLVSSVLWRMADVLTRSGMRDELDGAVQENGVLDTHAPKDLVRLMSCLQFIFCLKDDFNHFGEGFCWGLTTLVHLVGGRARFELLDFSYHTIRMDKLAPFPRELPKKSKKEEKNPKSQEEMWQPYIVPFLYNACHVKQLNDSCFDSLESYFLPPAPRVLAL